jgi:hypothetical protein
MRNFKNQKELFMHIWNSRPHVSELTGEPLLPINNDLWHFQFLHVLPKGSYPSYKLREENIKLGLPDEHKNQEQYKIFMIWRDELRRKYYKEIYGKEF